MALLLPKEEQGSPLTVISLDKIKSIYPYSVPFLKPIGKNKVKIRHNFTKLLGSKLPALLTGKIILNALRWLGFELKEQKDQKEGTRFTFRAMFTDDIKVELQMMIVPSANDKSVIQLATGWEAKNSEDVELTNQVIISTIILNLVIEKEYLTLDDRAFVVHCASCGYQINILKTKIQLFVVQCKNCSTENIVAPNVYKITKDVLR